MSAILIRRVCSTKGVVPQAEHFSEFLGARRVFFEDNLDDLKPHEMLHSAHVGIGESSFGVLRLLMNPSIPGLKKQILDHFKTLIHSIYNIASNLFILDEIIQEL